ncbi:MerR family transcriptional regulator [Pseudonocardia phyllosphaerae]|uniref:MerR family transcriptional regulator n=1 Tax=Pseudonocardia phyllosphaerae TaxID=3390502 RepID=UPI00397BB9C3
MSDTTSRGDGYPIDELAARAGMTVRNVRAHLSRGLLPAGTMHGRTAWYGPEHLSRLELIAGLQRRGFSLAAIGVLIAQTPSGGAEEALRLYRGMLAPWEPDDPAVIDADGLDAWAGADLPRSTAEQLVAAGLAEHTGDGRLRLLNPSLVRAGTDAIALGLAPEAVIATETDLQRRTSEIAEMFVGLFREQVWAPHVAAGLPASGGNQVRTAIEALQPIAVQALLAAFSQTMQQVMDRSVEEASVDLAAALQRTRRHSG